MVLLKLLLQSFLSCKYAKEPILDNCLMKSCFSVILTLSKKLHEGNDFLSFENMLLYRQNQATRSGLIKVKSESCLEEFFKTCERFGPVKKHFCLHRFSNQLIYLVEFENVGVVTDLFRSTGYDLMPKVLSFQRKSRHLDWKLEPRETVRTYSHPATSEITREFCEYSTVDEQLQALYNSDRLSDVGMRLRFLACNQIEDILQKSLPGCQAQPFGSTVNGFGKYDCDLDILLNHSSLTSTIANNKPKRVIQKENLKLAHKLLKKCSYITDVFDITRARVPIIKIKHSLIGLDCDISNYESASYNTSKVLYLLGKFDPRVQPLIFFLRRWARAHNVTKPYSGMHFTNFLITLLAIFFLQNRNPPVLPPLQKLQDTEDVKNNSRNPTESLNEECLGSLLKKFFVFYGTLPFDSCAISIVTGHTFPNPESPRIYIQNPLEISVNASRIVTQREVDCFVNAIRNSLNIMEEQDGHASSLMKILGKPTRIKTWKRTKGLLTATFHSLQKDV